MFELLMVINCFSDAHHEVSHFQWLVGPMIFILTVGSRRTCGLKSLNGVLTEVLHWISSSVRVCTSFSLLIS